MSAASFSLKTRKLALLASVCGALLLGTPAAAKTTLTRNAECEVTITVPIEITGKRATPELAKRWKEQIEAKWNGPTMETVQAVVASWGVEQKFDMTKKADKDDPESIGESAVREYKQFLASIGADGNSAIVNCCKINIRVDIRIRKEDAAPTPGFHQVQVHARHEGKWSTAGKIPLIGEYVGEFEVEWFRSYVQWGSAGSDSPIKGSTSGSQWADDQVNPPWAHEVGHLLGLDDDYEDIKDENGKTKGWKPKPGHDNNDLMADSQAWPEEDAFRQILKKFGLAIDCCNEKSRYVEIVTRKIIDARNAIGACDRDMIQEMILQLQAERAKIAKEAIPVAVKFELVRSIDATLQKLEEALANCPQVKEIINVHTGIDGSIWCTYSDGTTEKVELKPADETGQTIDGFPRPTTPLGGQKDEYQPTKVEQPKLPDKEVFAPKHPSLEQFPPPTTPLGGVPETPTRVEQPKLPPTETFPPKDPKTPEKDKPKTPEKETTKTPDVPPAKIPDTIFVKATEKVLEGGNGEPLGGQTVKLFPPNKPDLPGTGKTAEKDKGFDKDPVECKTDKDGGCKLKVEREERPVYKLPDDWTIGRNYRLEFSKPQHSGGVAELPNGTPAGGLTSPDGTSLRTDTFQIGNKTYLRLGLDVPYGRTFKLNDYYTPMLPRFEVDFCRDKQPGPPLGADPASYSAVGNDLPEATLKLSTGFRRGK